MASYNRVTLMGNLTRDPDYKQLSSGQAVCRLGLATNRQFKNRQTGDMVQEVCYIDIDVWGAQAESCRQYLTKGRAVLVEGRLRLDNWEDQNGQSRSKHSVVADRVVFLASQGQANVETDDMSVAPARLQPEMENSPREPQNELERELMSQLDQVKKRAKPAAAAPAKRAQDTGMTDSFKDEPPFQDDLPF